VFKKTEGSVELAGVGVPQRGHVIVLAPDGWRGLASGPRGAAFVPTARAPAVGDPGGVANGPDGGIIGAPRPGAKEGEPGVVCCNVAPQLRQNFIPGGFSPRHAPQITDNPAPGPGVCAVGGGASALPQFRQNDEPTGLWWPQLEQRSID
jgi:hypothetical protein